jgi:hypothetical protein
MFQTPGLTEERPDGYRCFWCNTWRGPKRDWGAGHVTCPGCKRIQPSISELVDYNLSKTMVFDNDEIGCAP